jgi:CRISP-associated protein Cas1
LGSQIAMAFRTVVVTSRCKLEYSLNYLICRGEDEKRIAISEISTLIIQNVGVAITAALLSKLMEAKVKVIFCDPKSNPQGELVSYYDNVGNFDKIKTQLSWQEADKNRFWAAITREKIRNQRRNLISLSHPSESLLEEYANEVEPGDPTNREGHAAKAYFSACFGKEFSRDQPILTNAYLNYGYSIILSSLNRAVKALGYLTEFGLHHIGPTNPFNLSCDLMEPLRAFIDYQVLAKKVDESTYKTYFVSLLEKKVSYRGASMFLENALQSYAEGVILGVNTHSENGPDFISYELD